MKKTWWKKKVTELMKQAGTYKEFFDLTIRDLAALLEERDLAYEEYVEDGRRRTIEKTSDRGAVNLAKNPKLAIWMDLNRDSLSYWKELGLTSKGYKDLMGEQALHKKKVNGLGRILEQHSGENDKDE